MERAFWACASGFVLGVGLVPLVPLSLSLGAFFILLALASLIAAPRAFIIPCFLCANVLGLWWAEVPLLRDAELDSALGSTATIEGVIIAEPDEREGSTRLTIELESGARVLVVGPPHVALTYGDRIAASGELGLPQAFETGEGRTFDYGGYLALSGIGYMLSFADAERITTGSFSFMGAAIALKQRYLDGLARALPEPHAGLAGGITAGEKRGLGTELGETFRVAGLTHIVVLSGYNIMIVIAFFERVFASCRRTVRLALGIGVAIFFVLMTGFAAASVRAAAMATIALFARASGRTYAALRALAIVALGMIAVNPRILLSDPGFQLSIIATWGLIMIAPLIESRLTVVTERMGLRAIVATTLGTQAAVLPLILYQSGLLSLVSLPANLLVLPAVPLAMLTSFIAGVAGIIAGPLAPFIGAPAYALLSYIIALAQSLAALPFSSLAVPPFPLSILVVFYAALILVVHARNEPQRRSN